jgi:hypothetical protein
MNDVNVITNDSLPLRLKNVYDGLYEPLVTSLNVVVMEKAYKYQSEINIMILV